MFKKRLLPALLCSALAGTTLPAQAVQFSGVYIFGDSLSDAGYYRPGLIAAGLPSSVVAGLGHFTTNPGPVWSEIVSQYYGAPGTPSNVAGGNIFAQGGMRVTDPAPASLLGPGGTQRPVSAQISEYLGRSNGVDPNALYGVWIGANDLFTQLGAAQAGAISAAQLQTNVLAAATAEIGQIGRLTTAGARYVLVFALPDVGATPGFAANPLSSSITQLSAGYNTTLFTGLQSAGIRVIPVDAFSLLNEIRANPAPYGFTNITAPACLPVGSSSLTCSAANLVAPNAGQTYLFADSVHPTAAAQRIVADFAISLIEGPQTLSLLAEVPLHTRVAHIRTIDSGLQQNAGSPVGKITAFAAGDGGKFDIDASPTNQPFDSKNRSATVGVTMRASEAVTLGAAIGKTTADATFGNSMGGFKTDETALSFFGSAKWDRLYANATISIADIDFRDVHRNVQLGQVTRVANSTTSGSNSSGSVTVGYDFPLSHLNVGPFFQYTAQSVDVNGFSEDGAGAAGLNVSSQRRTSRVGSLGVRASMDLGNFTPFVRFSADREYTNEAREVLANPVTVTSGNTYGIPAYIGDNSWGTFTLGVRGKLTDRIGMGVVYSNVTGRSGVKLDSVTANVSYQF